MNPIVIIEDDADDQLIIRTTFEELGVPNKLEFFDTGDKAYDFLCREEVIPFLILSDINMPGMNGFQLRDKLHEDEDLRRKCIPYIFITIGGDHRFVWEAYAKNAQGFFIKPDSDAGWKKLLFMLFNYWEDSKKPRKA